jgi:hypothetical protein
MSLQGMLESIRASGQAQLRVRSQCEPAGAEIQVEADAQASVQERLVKRLRNGTLSVRICTACLEALHNLGTAGKSLIKPAGPVRDGRIYERIRPIPWFCASSWMKPWRISAAHG